MAGMLRRMSVSVLRYVWEFADALERLPESLPNDMRNRLVGGAAGGVIGTGLCYVGMTWVLGPLFPLEIVGIIYSCGLIGATPAAMGVARGWSLACVRANIEAAAWKRLQIEGRAPLSLLPER